MISCVILNYCSQKLLKRCIESALGLKFSEKEIIVIDNASTDGSVPFALENFPGVRVIANKENLGYAGGANQAVTVSRGEFILILNPDIIFEPNYLDILIKRLRDDPEIAAISGKLKKYDFEHDQKTNIIDSAGLLMYRSRRCVDRGQGEEDKGQFDIAEEVFGITGACPLYRRQALEEISLGPGEYFDKDFFMYKEDVDISWRLRLAGFKCFYEPKALAYHGRGTGAISRSNLWEIAMNRRHLSNFQRFHSYKNERLMRVKNELPKLFARDFLPIVAKEILTAGWAALREPVLFKSFFRFLGKLPAAIRKRRIVMAQKRVDDEEMGKWFQS